MLHARTIVDADGKPAKEGKPLGIEKGYSLKEAKHPSYFTGGDGICAEVLVYGKVSSRFSVYSGSWAQRLCAR